MTLTKTSEEISQMGRIVATASGTYVGPETSIRMLFKAILIYRRGTTDGTPYEVYLTWIERDPADTYRRVMSAASARMAYRAMEPATDEGLISWESEMI